MRRYPVTSLIVGSSLALASCGGTGDPADVTTPTTRPPETVPITEPPITEPAVTEAPVTAAPSTEPVEPDATAPSTDPVADPASSFAPPPGAAGIISTLGFDDTVAAATAAIEGNDALRLVATIDHAANAADAGLELAPTTELIFGNPTIGTPLMNAAEVVGIDLPQKLLVIETEDGAVRILWNRSAYLAERHGLSGVEEQLETVDLALAGIASAAAGVEEEIQLLVGAELGEDSGLVTRDATGTAREAADRLLAAIDENPNLALVAEIDHGANARNAGLELSPIIEVVFGNPNLGTPLMQESQTIGMDLPQKMLFVETETGVTIVHNDPTYLGQRHGIDPDMPELATIAGALDTLSGVAAGAET